MLTERRPQPESVRICFGDLVTDALRIGVKGRPIAVDGSLRTRERENPDGTKQYDLEIVADAINELETRTPSRDGRDAEAPAAVGDHAL
jgi:single-stranded DNA-binding protein